MSSNHENPNRRYPKAFRAILRWATLGTHEHVTHGLSGAAPVVTAAAPVHVEQFEMTPGLYAEGEARPRRYPALLSRILRWATRRDYPQA